MSFISQEKVEYFIYRIVLIKALEDKISKLKYKKINEMNIKGIKLALSDDTIYLNDKNHNVKDMFILKLIKAKMVYLY